LIRFRCEELSDRSAALSANFVSDHGWRSGTESNSTFYKAWMPRTSLRRKKIQTAMLLARGWEHPRFSLIQYSNVLHASIYTC